MELLQSLWAVVVALANVLVELLQFVAPWIPLLAWIAFWLCAVNWRKLSPIIFKGGFIGVALTWLIAILVWSVVSIPEDGMHHLFGLNVSNIYGKMVYVTGLIVIAFLCGSVQNSGCCARICTFDDTVQEESSPSHSQH